MGQWSHGTVGNHACCHEPTEVVTPSWHRGPWAPGSAAYTWLTWLHLQLLRGLEGESVTAGKTEPIFSWRGLAPGGVPSARGGGREGHTLKFQVPCRWRKELPCRRGSVHKLGVVPAPALLEPQELAIRCPWIRSNDELLAHSSKWKNQPCEIKPVSENFLDGIHKVKGEKVECVKSSSS